MNGVERYKFSLLPDEPLYTNVLTLRQTLKSEFPGQIRGFQNYYAPKITLLNSKGGSLSDHLCFLNNVPRADGALSVSYKQCYYDDWKGYIGISLNPSDALMEYRQNVMEVAQKCGLSVTNKKWRYGPHITLGRLRRKEYSENKRSYHDKMRHLFNRLTNLAESTALGGTLNPGFLRQVIGDNTNVRYLFKDNLNDTTSPPQTPPRDDNILEVSGRKPLRGLLFGG